MGSGVEIRTGSFVGTGATKSILTLQFTPKYVKLINRQGLCMAEWSDTMPSGMMAKQVTDGTMTFPTTLGITPVPNKGFIVGADTDINVAGETVHWVAYE